MPVGLCGMSSSFTKRNVISVGRRQSSGIYYYYEFVQVKFFDFLFGKWKVFFFHCSIWMNYFVILCETTNKRKKRRRKQSRYIKIHGGDVVCYSFYYYFVYKNVSSTVMKFWFSEVDWSCSLQWEFLEIKM